MVDLPAPERPVNHRMHGLLALELGAGTACSTSSACQWMLVARRRPKRIMPAATVALVKRSIRMKEPVVRLSS